VSGNVKATQREEKESPSLGKYFVSYNIIHNNLSKKGTPTA
jgi:hypothetical protein